LAPVSVEIAIGRNPILATLSGPSFHRLLASSFSGLGMLLIMAILVIYLVFGVLYESFIHPLTILSGLPSAGLGALITLLLFKDELNIFSFVGISC
jgi:hydrophobic/amphiphilic exporter-1 (mainly G- bacteria), HAE1 family